VIDFKEIALGKQVGLGSYGVVFLGKWKGINVAVKRVRQERQLAQPTEHQDQLAAEAETC